MNSTNKYQKKKDIVLETVELIYSLKYSNILNIKITMKSFFENGSWYFLRLPNKQKLCDCSCSMYGIEKLNNITIQIYVELIGFLTNIMETRK